MKNIIAALALCALSVGALGQERDARADAVGKEFLAALGGQSAWDKARQFKFDFVVVRDGQALARFSHAWDRYTGDYRVSGTDKTGAPFVVYFNVNTKAGQGYVNGKPAEGEANEALLKNAYGRFINDTYWLLAPWKIFDPGVHLAYEGEKPCPGGGTCDVLRLSFDNVGLTPKDRYWLWITRDGRKMVQWQYLLNGATDEPTTAQWKEWQTVGGLALSMDKPISGKPAEIKFENVSVGPTRDDTLFKPPAGQ
ncbi:MAG TPA: hypothetical protein VIZ69_01855 [Thermoanaerobaculia bacterium]